MEKPAPTDVPLHDLLTRRWSPRAFADRPVAPDVLRRLFEAARWAPSSYNEQPWAFLVATRDEPEEHARVLSCLVEGNQKWAGLAPVLVLTFARERFTHNGQPNAHAWHDVGAAMSDLTTQATAEGLFVHQMAGIVPARVRATFAVPEGWSPVAGAAIGYGGSPDSLPDPLRERESASRQRRPMSSFVYSGAWGKPEGWE